MLPTIALGVGVVVAGLGIGAFLSVVQNTTRTTRTTATPVPHATRVALATAYPAAIRTATPAPETPTPSPTPKATPSPRPTASPSPTPAAARPSARPSRKPTATPAATPQPTPHETASAPQTAPSPPPTERPRATARPSARPAAVARATAPSAPSLPVSGFAAQAQATVRRYLGALIAGNESAAYAALGASPGDPSAHLSEEAFIDRTARVTSVRTRSVDAGGATIDVEILSSHGSYFATYHVSSGPEGPVIDQHDYIRV